MLARSHMRGISYAMNAAIIVAHPDDEVIWAGGLVLRRQDCDWSVLALCRADDPDRAPKFRRVCDLIGADGTISNLDDSSPLRPIDPHSEIGGRVLECFGDREWDLVLTHGPNGEYGHERHRQTHQAVAALVESGRLRTERLWTFAYEVASPAGDCHPAPWADLTVDLSPEQLAEKKHIVRDEYGYPENGFEVRACISPEAFSIVRQGNEELLP